MNIFQVLSQGKSRLHEPSMSAMLGYLLDSNKDHGLGDTFIRKFLEYLDKKIFAEILNRDFINSQVSLEEPYQLNQKRKDIDIQVILLNEKKEEIFRLIIENKIKATAANPKQLQEYYTAIITEEPGLLNLFMIFLTPDSKVSTLQEEYNNLLISTSKNHRKKWIYWESKKDNGILNVFREVLMQEMNGSINPINEYIRHTLKAFIRHSSLITQPLNKQMRTGEDIGEVIDEISIKTSDGKSYQIIRRDSNQIQVFNEETGDKEIAKTIMKQYISERNLDIQHKGLNTRELGRLFFGKLKT
ncbi:MAG: PD-(D/E)XK nuclease family protein [Planctomycetota bacterium]